MTRLKQTILKALSLRRLSFREKIILSIYIFLVFLPAGFFGVRALHRHQLKEKTKEARTLVRMLAGLQHSIYEETLQFRPIPPNVSDVPRGTCEPLSRIPKEWFEKARLSGKWFKKLNGKPCFRYRYQVVACPGSSECKTKEIQDIYRWYEGDPPFFVSRAEGDLDGNGITSLFEGVIHVNKETGEVAGGPCGLYAERTLE